MLVLASPLHTIDAFLAGKIADGLQEAALANLAGYESVNVVLDLIDLVDAGDFGLVQRVYRVVSCRSKVVSSGKYLWSRKTLCCLYQTMLDTCLQSMASRSRIFRRSFSSTNPCKFHPCVVRKG
jgi:hypothetical protein